MSRKFSGIDVGDNNSVINDHLKPATHDTMISSKAWPADEPSPSSKKETPKKKTHSVKIDSETKPELLGLDMSGISMKNLSPNICNFTFLTELRLASNRLTRLPEGISKLRSLNFLDLSDNILSNLPNEIGWLTNLKELLLYNNRIYDFPSQLGYLYQLENLGLNGNPLSENIKQIVQNQGELAVISFLRDHMMNIIPPVDRIWHTIDTFSQDGQCTITVLSYNVLCDKYATSQAFGYVPAWFLNWEYRKQVIIHEILSYDADILCLQEVETSQFEQYFKPQLLMRGGYEGIFYPKSRSKTMNEWDKSFVDGCAIFFKNDRFKMEDQVLVEFNQKALSKPSLRKHRDMYNRVMTRDQIAVFALLEHKDSGQKLIVANVHIHWDPSFRDVKLIQTIMMTEELEKLSNSLPDAALIVCGDFNSLPGSGVCSFLESGRIDSDHADYMDYNYEPYTTLGSKHSLALQNAYSLSPEPINFTNFTPNFLGAIDYIWFQPGVLSVTGCLGNLSADYAKQVVGLPSQHYPSDHLSLLVEFKIDRKQFGDTSTASFSKTHPPLYGSQTHKSSSAGEYKNRGDPVNARNSPKSDSKQRLYSRNKSYLS